jgi:hypothetical protein
VLVPVRRMKLTEELDFCDVSMLEAMRAEGADPDARLDAYIRLYNNCFRDRATKLPELTVGLHLCRFVFRCSYYSDQ